ncbi:tyrosine-type recombinase/integrase [Paraburkholderia ultramafica]|nr:tyrosine-type recombinase/integrase [Paraburkholderia ultramafica]
MPTELTTIVQNPEFSPPAVFAPDRASAKRFLEFFTANIRNPNTRRAYWRAVVDFASWWEMQRIGELRDIEPVHIAAYVETLALRLAAPSVKVHLAAIKMLFDWLVVGQVVASNPASVVRGPKHSVKQGSTPVLSAEDTRALLNSIDVSTVVGLRDRALIALMTYTFARVGAVIKMKVEDVYEKNRRLWVCLREKGGKLHEMPAHHSLEAYLHAYLEQSGLTSGFLFRSAPARTGQLTERPLAQADVHAMIGRRVVAAGIATPRMKKIGCHSFRATGITEYLRNGGKLEVAQQMANHESARTTGLYDRRNDQVSLDEVERIVI